MMLMSGSAWIRGAALAVATAALAVGAAEEAAAQTEAQCFERFAACTAPCRARCAAGDERCVDACERGPCAETLQRCLAQARGPAAAPRSVRPRALEAAPAEAAAPPPGAPRVQTDVAPLNARIFFLRPGKAEPSAAYYGYLIIGPKVAVDRKQAVAKALACRLQALPDAAAAAAVERLGLISLPARREAGATEVAPADVLEAYDFNRAGRWLRAAGFSVRQNFSDDDAVLFVASRFKRARQMDAVALAPPVNEDPVIADASALTAPYLGAWAGKVIDGIEAGDVRSRQDLQLLMEANSWLEWAQTPIASLIRITPALASNAPPACPE